MVDGDGEDGRTVEQGSNGFRRRLRQLVAALLAGSAVAAMVIAVAVANSPSTHGAIVDNGTVQLGINDWGNLNYRASHDSASGQYSQYGQYGLDVPAQSGVLVTGLRLLRPGQRPLEATADGCTCEGWGVADAATGLSAWANDAESYTGLAVTSFTHNASNAVSVVRTTGHIGSAPGPGYGIATVPPTLEVTQDYHPSAVTPYLYEDSVTIKNIGAVAADDLRYRRVMDWDIEPTQFNEYSTIDGTATANLLFSGDNGFDAEVWSLGESSVPGGPSLGIPATFVFAFSTVAASAVGAPNPALSLTAPPVVGATTTGTPPTFAVTANLHNYGGETAPNLTTALDLTGAAGLHLVSPASPAALGDLASGHGTTQTWQISADALCGDATYRVRVTADWTGEPRSPGLVATRAVIVHGTCGRIYGILAGTNTFGHSALVGATVELCDSTASSCSSSTTTDSSGRYEFDGLAPGAYTIRATGNGPFTTPATKVSGPVAVGIGSDLEQDFQWDQVERLDDTTSLSGAGLISSGDGYPTIYWEASTTLHKAACPPGASSSSARFRVLGGDGTTWVGWTTMSIGSDGSFAGTIPALYPRHGASHTAIEVTCGAVTTSSGFDVYIDPSGAVNDTNGNPIAGATVTLFRYEGPTLGYVAAPNGSAIMSPANQKNPDSTNAAGHFGWDVTPGNYKVRAFKSGCHAVGDASTPYAESALLSIPPAVTDLVMTLDCPVVVSNSTAGPGATPASAAPDLVVTLAVSPGSVIVGHSVTYTALVTNRGTAVAPGATLTARLPVGIAFLAGSTSTGGTCTQPDPRTVSYPFGPIGAGQTATATIAARLGGIGTLSTSVSVLLTGLTVQPATASVTVSSRAVPLAVSLVAGAKAAVTTTRKYVAFSTRLHLNRTATLTFRLSDSRTGKRLHLLAGSIVARARLAHARSSVTVRIPAGGFAVRLRVARSEVQHRHRYRLVVASQTQPLVARSFVFRP